MTDDFRDHRIQKALDEVVGQYRPEKDSRARVRRVVLTAVIALAAFAAFWTALHFSSPRHAAKPAARPVAVELVPAPAKR